MESIGKDWTVLQDEEWKCELVFLADVTTHLKVLNLQLQGRNQMITDMYDAVKAFQMNMFLQETQKHHCNLPHFPCCQVVSNQVDATMFPNVQFADKLNALRSEFTQRFGNSEAHKMNFELFRNPFAIDAKTFPVKRDTKCKVRLCGARPVYSFYS